jgi:hypothetical protein
MIVSMVNGIKGGKQRKNTYVLSTPGDTQIIFRRKARSENDLKYTRST